MTDNLELTDREQKEIKLALFYESECDHGTAGHNRLLLIAKLARALGFKAHAEFSFTCWPDAVDAAGETAAITAGVDRYDWAQAERHLLRVKSQYEGLRNTPGVNVNFALVGVICPLQERYNRGERTRELYDEMMALE